MLRVGLLPRVLLARISGRVGVADRGATAVEYSLMVALIAAVIAVVVGLLGTQVSIAFSSMIGTF